jgi:metal-responsive CopG/Arc/MetJ family transcriptional regulator
MEGVTLRKVTISLPGDLVEFADRTARRSKTSRSRVISRYLAEARARDEARLAAEGYRFYAGEAREFSEVSAGTVAETMEPYLPEE